VSFGFGGELHRVIVWYEIVLGKYSLVLKFEDQEWANNAKGRKLYLAMFPLMK
jgi:hypothetical protein